MMDALTRAALVEVFDAALSDVKQTLIYEILNKPGEARTSELNQLDTLKRLENRINARLECYTKPAGTE